MSGLCGIGEYSHSLIYHLVRSDQRWWGGDCWKWPSRKSFSLAIAVGMKLPTSKDLFLLWITLIDNLGRWNVKVIYKVPLGWKRITYFQIWKKQICSYEPKNCFAMFSSFRYKIILVSFNKHYFYWDGVGWDGIRWNRNNRNRSRNRIKRAFPR